MQLFNLLPVQIAVKFSIQCSGEKDHIKNVPKTAETTQAFVSLNKYSSQCHHCVPICMYLSVLFSPILLLSHFFILFDRHPVRQGLGSHLQINADALCDELTANLIKLEKVTSCDIMQMLIC